MKFFLSCDWGTSSFRLRFVDVSTLTFSVVENKEMGIGRTFELWKQSGGKEEERHSFYIEVIRNHIEMLEQQLKRSVRNTPLVISGMAFSSIGMTTIPYKEAPFRADGSDLETRQTKRTSNFEHDILMISGARTDHDTMRGEETQLAGCIHHGKEERLFIFPGTHSKHILVKNGLVTDFKTYMTGEFFEILSQRSILSNSVQEGDGLRSMTNRESFGRGVLDSAESNLLHTGFLVRTNDLFNKLTKQENYYYLSGLLIGTELREVIINTHKKITLVVGESIKTFYVTALEILRVPDSSSSFGLENADMALIKGQLNIWSTRCKTLINE